MSARSPVTSHVLDTALGRPAVGVAVRLDRLDGVGWTTLGRGVTDQDGRLEGLLAPPVFGAGTYRLTFDTKPYFAASHRPTFYPHVDIVFVVERPDEHHHVPLLVSPFGYCTYRGS